MPPFHLTTDARSMKRLFEELSRERTVAFDIECASGLHHYERRVCLMQAASHERVYIIDPLAGLDLAPLKSILEDPAIEIVLHDADFDMRSLDRDYGWRPRNIFDTLVAARLCGHRKFGLSSMLERYFGIAGSKRYQRADWTVRPLPPDMLDYAAGDVARLVELRDILAGELESAGRMEWARRKFRERESIRHEPDERPLFARVKRARESCDGRQLAVLREIAGAREEIARDLDLPPFKVISDQALIELARRPPSGAGELRRRRGMHPFLRGRGAARMQEAIDRGQSSGPIGWPQPERRGKRRGIDDALLKKLKAWRDRIAEENGLDPDLILTMDSMRSIAAGKGAGEVLDQGAVRGWGEVDVISSVEGIVTDHLAKKSGN